MKNHKFTAAIFLTILSFLFIMDGYYGISIASDGAAGKPNIKTEVKQKMNPYGNGKIISKIIPSANKTFGYDILLNGKTLVHQPNIPGLPGNNGFTTKEKAQKVADFVVSKIRNNEMPPTVTVDDLKKMRVLK